MGIHTKIKADPSFPIQEVESCIRSALNEQVEQQNILRPRSTSACDPTIDSLVVVELICAIEETLGVALPASFAPRGGYEDVETCVSELVAETRGVWVNLVKKEQHHE
tara:strand:+ start:572 stop:895 length:324 start_codon:yes stop_codon:yes gene_type:complete